MIVNDIIGCERIGSAHCSCTGARHDTRPLTETDRKIIRSIPYWPDDIKICRLARKVRLSNVYVNGRIGRLTFRTRIFESREGYVSRLREDLSNVD